MKMLRKANNRGKLKYGAFKAVKHLSKLAKNLKKLAELHGQSEKVALVFEKITNQITKINKKAELNIV